jgi:Alpha-mannosidase
MFFYEHRIDKILEELRGYIYESQIKIHDYKMSKTDGMGFEKCAFEQLDWPSFSDQDIWGGHRERYWFVTKVEIPAGFEGKTACFMIQTGREGEWDATNPQFTIYRDGELVCGLDVNHREIILCENASAGKTYTIALSAFTGDNNFRLDLKSQIAIKRDDIKKLYYDLKIPYDVAMLLDENNKRHTDIISKLNDAMNLLDLRVPFSDMFHDSIRQAQQYMTEKFYSAYCGESSEECWCVGHTHIDVAWLWTLVTTRDKALRSFSTALDLMKRYPEYKFMSSQPQLYKYVKERSPEIYGQIKKRIAEGRWEAEGGMFVEADCNLPSGESLIRQILFGKAV